MKKSHLCLLWRKINKHDYLIVFQGSDFIDYLAKSFTEMEGELVLQNKIVELLRPRAVKEYLYQGGVYLEGSVDSIFKICITTTTNIC